MTESYGQDFPAVAIPNRRRPKEEGKQLIKLSKGSMIVGFSFINASDFGDHIHSFCLDCFVVITQQSMKIFWVGKIAV